MFEAEKNKNVKKNKENNNTAGVVRNKYGTGVRSYLVNAGFDNSDIGYDKDNFRVTYKGKPVIMPNSVVDGTSYADEGSLRELALKLHKDEGRELVSAADYAAQETGIKNAASVGDGYVSVGGKTIKAPVSSDGRAYVPKEEMKEALDEYKNEIDYKSEKDIYNQWESRYADKTEKALEELMNDSWSYNPEEDPAYQAYADLYRREGQRAFSEAFGNGIANTDGYINSAALTAASQGLAEYTGRLTDKIPELMKDSYERYAAQRGRRMEAVKELISFGNGVYDKMYSSNSDYLNRLNEAEEFNYEQSVKGDERETAERKAESEILNNYINAEKGLTELEYLPAMYEAEISGDIISRALKELELEYRPELYEAEIDEYRRNGRLKDLEAKYFLWK